MNTRRLTTAASVTVLLGLSLAACGGAKRPPSSSGSGAPQQGAAANDAYKFSACMRTHGVTNFQDPKVSSIGDGQQISIRVDPAITSSPDFKSRQRLRNAKRSACIRPPRRR